MMKKTAMVLGCVILCSLAANLFALDTTDDGTGIISAFGENLPDEGMTKAFDNSNSTKWLDFKMDTIGYSWIQYQYASGKTAVVTEYTITSANDAQERDPMDWTLQGSNNGGASWDTLDTRTNVQFATRFLKQSFLFSNSTAYNIYRLYITQVRNGTSANSVQLAEIELIGTFDTTIAYSPSPADDSVGVSPNVTLSWIAGDGADSHDVYFGTSLNDVNNAERLGSDIDGDGIVDWEDLWRLTASWLLDPAGTEPFVGMDSDNIVDFYDYALFSQDWMGIANPVYKGNSYSTSFDPGTLELSTTYYWRIDEVNGTSTTKGDLWSFTTASGKASNPNPADGATYVPLNTALIWSAGTGSSSHNVYFGTANPPASQGNQSGTSFDPGPLDYETTYYWRIDEVGDFGTVQGDTWSFTTTDGSYSLNGKIVCGYQGWFACAGDSSGRGGWVHWSTSSSLFDYTHLKIDMWPDMDEYANQYITGFNLGSPPYYVFSSYDANTTMVHFKWMQEYGIDGVFVQRFGSDFGVKNFMNTILGNCKTAANYYGRKYAVMYDLTGYTTSSLVSNITADWIDLENNLGIADSLDDAYITHNGKPVIAIYGIFGAGVSNYPDPALCATLIQWFKDRDFTVMIGVNNDWQSRMSDPDFASCITKADIIMPWNVGRYDSGGVASFCNNNWVPDLNWCGANNKDYSVCIFPGFSWNNWNGGGFNKIPRNGGQFLWDQLYLAKSNGANMIYVAMFDEVDEGTAIFKVSNDPPPPSGGIQFVTLDVDGYPLPTDEYLWLVGQASRGMRGEIPVNATRPAR
ncbi:MAG: hypothetical protein PHP01_03525, partial [Phycisphaerae bacterium]|nr:hypothetical protein [Phycisphaerae bacterium]